MRRIVSIIILVILALCPITVLAVSTTVCNSGCNYSSISAALSGVGNGNHTISVQAPYTGNDVLTISQSGTSNTSRLNVRVRAGDAITVQSFVVNGSNIIIDGFKFNGATGNASVLINGNNVTVQNCTIMNTNAALSGIMTKYNTPYVDNLLIQNNTISGSLGHHLWIYATNSNILNNTASNSGMDFLRLWGNNNLIQGNVVHDFNCEGENHPDFVQTWGSDGETSTNMTLDGNFIYNSCIQPCNLSADNDNRQHTWTFRNNIFYHVGGGANVGIPNVSFYNNTFYDSNYYNQSHAIGYMGTGGVWAGTGGIVKNNIFISNYSNGWYTSDAALTADYNYAATTTWGRKTGFSETHGVNGGNPYLLSVPSTTASNWALTANSMILIDKGATISGFTNDFVGNTRSGAWDIGAFELGGPAPPITLSPPANLRISN